MDVTVLVFVLITETVPSSEFVTYTFFPSGVTVIPKGTFPTGTVVVTVLVFVLITETVSHQSLSHIPLFHLG